MASLISFIIVLWDNTLQVVFSPVVPGSTLLALSKAPNSTLATAVRRLCSGSKIHLSDLRTALYLFLAFGTVYRINRVLNGLASNSWRHRPVARWDWSNEIAVVTGGCGGIGERIVEQLVQRDVKVAILDVQDPPTSLACHKLVRYYQCDVTSSKSVAEAADALRHKLGHPSILINNAGIGSRTPILDMPEDRLDRTFRVNCMSHWITTQAFMPRMIELNKGHIVTVASIASFTGLSVGAEYGATKAGLMAFHETLGCELRNVYKSDGILTSIVHPSFVKTSLLDGHLDDLKKSGAAILSSEYVANEITNQIFQRRAGQLVIPGSLSFMSGIRAWPTWIQEALRDHLARSTGTS